MTAPSLRLLLSTLIDYTGVFLPANLELANAVAAYERYSAGDHRWMLGRLVLPMAQLPQFEIYLDNLKQYYAPAFWPLSIVLAPSLQALDLLAPWLEKQYRFTVSALEFTQGSPDAIAQLLPHLPPHSDLFFEVPLNPSLPDYLAQLRGTRAAAKIRTGGLTAAEFPSVETLAQFIVACAKAKIPFKAGGGLHHPLRGLHKLPNGRLVKMHGFLNLALAAAFAYGYGATATEIATLLHIDTPEALIFSAQEIICHSPVWSNDSELSNIAGHLPLEILAHVRSRYFLGISACSFHDPLIDLNRLGILKAPTPTTSCVLSM